MTISLTVHPLPSLSPHQIKNSASQSRASLECSVCNTNSDAVWGEDGFSFKDILDTVNPLQQLPLVSNIYRGVTGDTISTGAKLLGGALLGGPAGFLMAAIGSAFEAITGGEAATQIAAAEKYKNAAKL